MDLISHLENKKFVFVFCGNKIGGFIHFSDLNNELVKLPLYLLFQAVESNLILKLDDKINEELLIKNLGNERYQDIKKKMENLKKNNANLNWFSLLYFGEIIRIACALNIIKMKGNEIDVVAKVRNLISHSGEPLVKKHIDVKKIVDAKKICYRILQTIT